MTIIDRDTALAADIRTLDSEIRGLVFTPGDLGWDEARSAWNLAVDQQVQAVVQVQDSADVVAAVQFARRNGYAVTAQPLGHGATHHLNGTIMLRFGAMQRLHVDIDRQMARVEPGVMMSDLLNALDGTGLTALSGSTAGVTVTGYMLGGGLSWFSRKHGFAANQIQAIELVTADGDFRRVTAESDPDLFWAVRGGGGDFAIVTALEFRLFPAPHVYGGRLMWTADYTRAVMQEFLAATQDAPEELSLWVTMLNLPPIDDVPEPLRGKSVIAIDATYLGSTEEGAAYLQRFHDLGQPIMDTFGTVPISGIGEIAQEPTNPIPAVEYSHLLTDLDESTIDALIEAVGPGTGSPLLLLQLRHIGGALTRTAPTQGAAGIMTEPYSLLSVGLPMGPELSAVIAAYNAELERAVAPVISGRTFFSFLGEMDTERAFSRETLARLRTIKLERDPQHLIRSNHPVLGRLDARVPSPR